MKFIDVLSEFALMRGHTGLKDVVIENADGESHAIVEIRESSDSVTIFTEFTQPEPPELPAAVAMVESETDLAIVQSEMDWEIRGRVRVALEKLGVPIDDDDHVDELWLELITAGAAPDTALYVKPVPIHRPAPISRRRR